MDPLVALRKEYIWFCENSFEPYVTNTGPQPTPMIKQASCDKQGAPTDHHD